MKDNTLEQLKQQILSVEQMLHLNELGIDISNGSVFWARFRAYNWFLSLHTDESTRTVPAFTLQQVIELLPKEINPCGRPYSLFIDYQEMRIAYGFVDREGMCWLEPAFSLEYQSLLNAAYEMLCWCIKEGYIKTTKQ